MILAGDVGGTKTRLALYAHGGDPRSPVLEHRAPSRDFATFDALVQSFLHTAAAGGERVQVERAAFGIAGPVVDNRSETTNLPWMLDGRALGRMLDGAEVTLMNDLEATGRGLPLLRESELETLQPGSPAHGNRALIAAGTGLGEGIMVWNGAGWTPTGSEGGHADFGPREPLEDELNLWLREKYGRVSYERILSGPGLADLHRFMRASGRGDEPVGVAERFDHAADPAAIVTATALDGTCARARLALELFIRIYGAEAGNLALKALAVAGLYVGGGIAPRIRGWLADGRFTGPFTRKGRLAPVLERIPVRLILDDRTALWGAAAVALAHPSVMSRTGE